MHEADIATARQFHQAGRFADAARRYHALLERQPDNADALHLFGVLHHQSGYFARAAELIGRAATIRPGASAYHANLAEAYRALGRYSDAIDSCQAALRLRPNYPEAANNLGLAMHELGRFVEAVARFRAAIDMRPDFALAHNNLGTSLRELGQIGRAMAAYRAAVGFDPELALARSNLGQLLVDQGQPEEGLTHCQEAVRLQPGVPAALNNLGNAYRALERWSEAHEAYHRSLAAANAKPQWAGELPQIMANRGLALFLEGRRAEGFSFFKQAVELAPDDVEMRRYLGNAHDANEDHAAALRCWEKIVEMTPGDAPAHNALGWSLQQEGRFEEAAGCYRRALELNSRLIDAILNQGGLFEELGDMSAAEASYRRARDQAPYAPNPLARLAQLLRGKLPDADRDAIEAQLFSIRAASPAPVGSAPRTESSASGETARGADPTNPAPVESALRTDLPGTDGRTNETARGAAPTNPAPVGSAPRTDLPGTDGRTNETARGADPTNLAPVGSAPQTDLPRADERANETARGADPTNPAPVGSAPRTDLPGTDGRTNETVRGADPTNLAPVGSAPRTDLPRANERANETVRGADPTQPRNSMAVAPLPPKSPARGPLLYGLAQVHDARGEYAEAAKCLEQANALSREQRRREGKNYDPAHHTALVDRMIAGFTPRLFERLAKAHSASPGPAADDERLPIFVFGMPRSGTSLVEQVLASHSRVHGAGELRLAREVFESIPSLLGMPDDMAACLTALDSAVLRQLHDRHLGELRTTLKSIPSCQDNSAVRDVKDRIVDKMPDNYLYLGLLAIMFPRASFIHVRRDLRDVAVSCWMTSFRSIRWADDRENLSARIRDYRRLMRHWQAVLPVPVHEVVYERLVDDFETHAARLLSACGLDWEPACGQFHQTSRPVRTASVTQVRQPLYRKALARWKHYEGPLAELFAALPVENESRPQRAATVRKRSNTTSRDRKEGSGPM